MISIPEVFYEKAIRTFERKSSDSIALPALLMLLDAVGAGKTKLIDANAILNSDTEIAKYMEHVRKHPPQNYGALLKRYEDRIRNKHGAEVNAALSNRLNEALEFLKMFRIEANKANEKADSRGQKLEIVKKHAEEQSSKLKTLEAQLNTANNTIKKLDETLDGEKLAREKAIGERDKAKLDAEEQHRNDKKRAFFHHVAGYGGTLLGIAIAIAEAPPVWKSIEAHIWTPSTATDQDKGNDKNQKKQEIEKAISGKSAETPKPAEPAQQTDTGSPDKNDKPTKPVGPPAGIDTQQQSEKPSSEQETVAPQVGAQTPDKIQLEQFAALAPQRDIGKKGRRAAISPNEAEKHAYQRSDLFIKRRREGSFRPRFG